MPQGHRGFEREMYEMFARSGMMGFDDEDEDMMEYF